MKKYIIFYLFLTGLMGYNYLILKSTALGAFLFLIYLLYFGRRLGILALSKFSGFWQRLFGPLFLLAAASLLGSLFYYAYKLNDFTSGAVIVLIPLLIIPYARYLKKDLNKWEDGQLEPVPLEWPNTGNANFGSWIVFFGDLYLLSYLAKHATAEAIRSPWTLISPKFFLCFLILTFILLLFLKRTKSSFRSLVTICLHVFLMMAAALIIYKTGFGFDPQLHRAAEKYIYEANLIEPKTPYYIGQYSLVVIISKISLLPLALVDKYLLIILEALFLPALVFLVFRHGFNFERPESRLASLLLFLIPFSSFIATTPQDTANFFGLALIFFTILYLTSNLISWRLPLLLLLTTICVHPLTGLPLGVLFILAALFKTHKILSGQPGWQLITDGVAFLLFSGSLIILPLIFIIFLGAEIHQPSLDLFKNFILPILPKPRSGAAFSLWQTAIYVYQFILPVIILAVSIFGAVKLIKKNPKIKLSVLLIVLSFAIFICNALFLKSALTLANIGAPEQGQYAERLLHFSLYLIAPLFLTGLIYFFLWLEKRAVRAGLLTVNNLATALILAGALTASFYLSYPRVDAYELSHYINTSIHDFKAVRQIEEKSQGQPYLVLSNISLAAAAIQDFGFKTYFNTPAGKIFFYSLPTGGPLYHFFEEMAYKGASRETMRKAMEFTGIRQSYFVLNDYWDSFAKASREAKYTADEWWEVDKGKILIFKYNL
ncbi:MAG: hypothetical protein HY982_00285 [Candidatus Magasanikbacteria bacterium]|nr:hypothetical protein [Candidatus Magasanikbacteria bacterium]